MGSDIFTKKCEAHNYMVPYRSSCPVCVSAKRSQLHAANLAHMPRYLFEQQLDVQADATGAPKPVRSFMKAPEQAKPCEVRWKVNFKSNYLETSYSKLSSTTQALLMALDVTTDARIRKMRQDYQAQIDSGATSPSEQDRLGHNLAIDMYYEIVRVSKSNIDDAARITGQFVDYFKLLYGNGQRLIVDETPAVTTSKFVLNFTSVNGASTLNRTTQMLLRKLDKYEGGLGKVRMDHERYIAHFTRGIEPYKNAIRCMANALWNQLPMDPDTRSLSKVMEQFLTTVEHLYAEGQRLTEITVSEPTVTQIIRDAIKAQDKQLPSVDDDLAGCLYNYLGTSSKELYHEQSLLEGHFDREFRGLTREGLIGRYRNLAGKIIEAYKKDKMYDWQKISFDTLRQLQERLTDAYLAGKRR